MSSSPSEKMDSRLRRFLRRQEEKGLLRGLMPREQVGGLMRSAGRKQINLGSNDYLNLSRNPLLKEEAAKAMAEYGTGAGSSRLMTGHLRLHEEVEELLASWLGYESALIFGSGFLANIGILSALGKNLIRHIYSDRLNHASLLDGTSLGRARVHRYRHNDPEHLEYLLRKYESPSGEAEERPQSLIVTESLFSMDGDQAELASLRELGRKYQTLLMVDEAHSIGLFGAEGRGLCALRGVRPDILLGTGGKALGSYGAFALCSRRMRSFLINQARSFIYTTALPPACLGALKAAVQIIRRPGGHGRKHEGQHEDQHESQHEDKRESKQDEPSSLGDQLLGKVDFLRALLEEESAEFLQRGEISLSKGRSPLLSLVAGAPEKALFLSSFLKERGIIVPAIRPPTVPPGTARLRLSLTLAHRSSDLRDVSRSLREALGAARWN